VLRHPDRLGGAEARRAAASTTGHAPGPRPRQATRVQAWRIAVTSMGCSSRADCRRPASAACSCARARREERGAGSVRVR
jgi:hypothetical protein